MATINGTTGNDSLTGTSYADTITAGAGNDSVNGSGGNDRIDGGDGNDSLQGGSGNDTLYGGTGADTLGGGTGYNTVYGGAGNDVWLGSDSVTAGSDAVYLEDGDDLAYAGWFNSGTPDTIDGGTGNDTISLANLPSGTDFGITLNDDGTSSTILFGSVLRNIENIIGNDGDNALTGNAQANMFNGDAGDDTLLGNAGNDTLVGGAGADLASGGADDDFISGDAGADTLSGGDGNDTLGGGADNDSVSGDLGNDYLTGGDGADTLSGGDGLDTLYGDGGNDLISGGAGDDLVFGQTGLDTIYGGDGDDNIYSSSDGSLVYGEAGNDLISGNFGADTIDGGIGADTILGGMGNDSVTGGEGNDSLTGGDGADTLAGGEGDDTLTGGEGNDLLDGGAGYNVYDGGAGSDTIVVADGSTGTIIGSEDGDDSDVDVLVVNRHLGTVTYNPTDAEAGTITWADGSSVSFSNIENVQLVPCFTPGTMIETKQGLVAVEKLKLGMRVMTRDSGYRPIRWIGRRTVTAADLALRPQLQPVRIRKGALGDGLPEADMVVSPQHRMLISGVRAELLFGEPEVLAAALHMVGQPGIERIAVNEVTYLHLMFDAHEIIRAEGAWTESFQPGDQTLSGLEAAQRDEMMAIFPDLRHPQRRNRIWTAARLSLKPHEVRVLLAA